MVVHTKPLGFLPAIVPAAAASGPLAPIIRGVAAGIGGLLKLFGIGFGPDPRKVPDTKAVEAANRAYEEIWYQVTGLRPQETSDPYEEIPAARLAYGPGGNPEIDIRAAIGALDQVYQQTRAVLLRSESVENLDTWGYPQWRQRLEAVARARASQPALLPTPSSPASLLPVAAALVGAVVLAEVLA